MSSHLVTDLKVVLTLARKAVKRTVLVINSIENKGLLDQANLMTEILAGATSQHLRSALPAPLKPLHMCYLRIRATGPSGLNLPVCQS